MKRTLRSIRQFLVPPKKMSGDIGTAISLYQFAVETLGKIQLARTFHEDFETHQLKLDVIQLRLSRWGQIARLTAVDNVSGRNREINEAYRPGRESHQINNEDDYTSINTTLRGIQDLFTKAEREARRIKKILNGKDIEELDPDICIPIDLKRIRTQFKQFLLKRKAQASKVIASIKWAFYKKDAFDKFVSDISELIDSLEKAIPDTDRDKLGQLSDEECIGISKSNLEELKFIIDGCDPWLQESVDKILDTRGYTGTVITQSHNRGSTVGIHNGHNKGVTNGDHSSQTNTFNEK